MSAIKKSVTSTVKTKSPKKSTPTTENPVNTLTANGEQRVLNARPDGLDFRDKMYVPMLIEVPVERKLEDYRKTAIPILNQGKEGACTGFGLATVVHYLLATRKQFPDINRISPYMLYDMARRYDEWASRQGQCDSAYG